MSPEELRALLREPQLQPRALWASVYYLISHAGHEQVRELYRELRLSGTSSALVPYLREEIANRGITP